MPDIHAIILTRDEERHIARCIASLKGQCTSITVIDSGSEDATVAIAEGLGARVIRNAWVNHATQMNFAIDALVDRGGWLLRIDADEVVDEDSRQLLSEAVASAASDTDGLLVQRRIHFMGRRIRYGAIEPSWQLRLWRNGRGRCEQRWMDEHIKVSGKVAKSELVVSDINLNSVTWWTSKHNSYASREAIEILNRRHGLLADDHLAPGGGSLQAKARRFAKEEIYSRIPRGFGPLLYFLYRYFIRWGFLDGSAGWYFCALHAFWYRTLVDAKLSEIETRARRDGIPIADAIAASTGIAISSAVAGESRNPPAS